MIDKTMLNKKIREAADLLLRDIQLMGPDELNENLRYFAEKAKNVAEGILEEYIFSVVSNYTEGINAIKDTEILSKFINFSSGYQQQMLDWIKNNPLEVKEEMFEFPQAKSVTTDKGEISPKIIFGAGTALAVGLFIFTNVWITLAAEIITTFLTIYQNKRISKQNSIKEEFEKKRYEASLHAKKDKLVNGMISELEKWLDLGETASNNIITSFGI